MTHKDILSFWPMKDSKPRPSQVTALKWIEQLSPHIKYILCQIPVGGGKSPVAVNMSSWISQSLGSSIILTPQKILQKQYEDSFDNKYIGSVYGKSNYNCASKKTNCDIGSAVKPPCESCPYKLAYAAAKSAPNIVLNYKLGLLYSLIGADLAKERDMITFDECHTLENHLTEFLAVLVTEAACKKLHVMWKESKTMAEALYFLTERYIPGLDIKIRELSELVKELEQRSFGIEGLRMSEKELDIIKDYKRAVEQKDQLTEITTMNYTRLQEEYVFIPEKNNFRFKEVYGARVFGELLEPLANRFLFMSATILNKDEFCRDLGLDPDQAAYISLESEFPVKNRPVIFMPTMKMTYGWDKPEMAPFRKDMIDTIVQICKGEHSTHSGVIHTGSFVVAKWLIGELCGKIPQRILEHGPDSGTSRDEVIDAFCTPDGTLKLLISPSVTEGLDLKDDLARFSIIAKTPYPFLGDAWVKRRMELSSSWYNRQAMTGIIQACGRAVRTPNDWATTYILDSSFAGLYNRIKSYVPKWWKDGYEEF
jgi:Rad3-related DNA helicase